MSSIEGRVEIGNIRVLLKRGPEQYICQHIAAGCKSNWVIVSVLGQRNYGEELHARIFA